MLRDLASASAFTIEDPGVTRQRAPGFVCSASGCAGELEVGQGNGPRELCCAACGARYPLLSGDLPVLAREPAKHLAAEAIRLRRDLAWLERQRGLLAAGERRFPRRAPTLKRLGEALERSLESFAEILALLTLHLDREAVVEVASAPPPDGGAYGARQLCSLLRRDFGGEPEGEGEISSLVDAVRGELAAIPHEARVLVLGCGTGRLAEELATAGAEVTAVDLSTVLLLAALTLQARPLALSDVRTRNARDIAAQAHVFTAQPRPPGPCRTARVRYAVADATALPFADASWPVIISAYFTDVVPLSRLLPAVWRVLAPGGHFIHVGPLGYHFDDPAEHLAADELLDAFRWSGFEVGPGKWIPGTHYRTAGSLCVSSFDNLVFSARKVRRRLNVEPPGVPFVRP